MIRFHNLACTLTLALGLALPAQADDACALLVDTVHVLSRIESSSRFDPDLDATVTALSDRAAQPLPDGALSDGLRASQAVATRAAELLRNDDQAALRDLLSSERWLDRRSWLAARVDSLDCQPQGADNPAPVRILQALSPIRGPAAATDARHRMAALIPDLSTLTMLLALIVVGAALACLRAALTPRIPDRRNGKRHPCFILGALRGANYCEPVTVLDISRSGCKLRLNAPLDCINVTLFIEKIALPGQIVWSNSLFAGVKFRNSLERAALVRLLDHDRMTRHDGTRQLPRPPCHTAECPQSCILFRAAEDTTDSTADVSPTQTDHARTG
ncbi:PilZ domain-containing protein [Albidovulum inexpectatum]|uniref:PilZ domain-containing protein n=1 Tax=Albidovulum inexpectatum TaxID=196587 RepID=A0A2S5JIN5_9RHOB|nr:PilZ domain-containing protein [Albidovulum inexpectatum]PPB81290.1 PilZ domain-containing protein [Albidovulum inexpectatum]